VKASLGGPRPIFGKAVLAVKRSILIIESQWEPVFISEMCQTSRYLIVTRQLPSRTSQRRNIRLCRYLLSDPHCSEHVSGNFNCCPATAAAFRPGCEVGSQFHF